MPSVYVIAQEGGLTKIGIAASPTARLSQLKRISAKPLTLHKAFETRHASSIEKAAHSHFREHLVIGEWFQIAPETAAEFINDLVKAHAVRVGRVALEPGAMITIRRSEYDTLLAERDALERAILLGSTINIDDELVPSDVAKRLIGGESPLRVWREYRGHTQVSLASLTGVNRVQIADIEVGRSTGSVRTLMQLADGLHLTIDDLV